MARITFNGEAGETWENHTGKVQYQFIVQWHNSCGLCAQYDHAIGPSWPIPLHYGCRCEQTLIKPGGVSDPFVDFREKIRELVPAQQSVVVGKASLQLIEAGVVKWDDVVTRSRVRLLREVVSREKLSVKAMTDAGVKESTARTAHATVTTPAHELADRQRHELVARLAAAQMTEEQMKREFGERLAKRLSIEEGPSGRQEFGESPKPKPKPTAGFIFSQLEPLRTAATAETRQDGGEEIPPIPEDILNDPEMWERIRQHLAIKKDPWSPKQ